MVGPPSLSVIVPSPVASLRSAPDGLLRITVNCSSDSCSVSSVVGTEMVIVVCRTENVSVPVVLV